MPFFTGSRYVPVLASGKSDVRQAVSPTLAATRTDPKLWRLPEVRSAISVQMSCGTVRKCHAPSPGWTQSGAANAYVCLVTPGRYDRAPTEPMKTIPAWVVVPRHQEAPRSTVEATFVSG